MSINALVKDSFKPFSDLKIGIKYFQVARHPNPIKAA